MRSDFGWKFEFSPFPPHKWSRRQITRELRGSYFKALFKEEMFSPISGSCSNFFLWFGCPSFSESLNRDDRVNGLTEQLAFSARGFRIFL